MFQDRAVPAVADRSVADHESDRADGRGAEYEYEYEYEVAMVSVSALILAGGKATRLGGVAKHELVIEGRTIFERQIEVLAPRVAEILVATPHDMAGYRCVRDRVPDIGPLAGIAAGLAAMHTPWLLVVAGDMPHLTGEVIDEILGAATEADDAVGVRVGGLPEPLVCLLHESARPAVDRRIEQKRFKASGLLTDEQLSVTWLELDRHARAFDNVNEPEDLGRITQSKPA
jgi:molybdopterin-guanine dinucleotide biosynthesis protein A